MAFLDNGLDKTLFSKNLSKLLSLNFYSGVFILSAIKTRLIFRGSHLFTCPAGPLDPDLIKTRHIL